MIQGLMGHCLNHEMALDRIRVNANSTEDKLNKLKAWQTGIEKKFAYTEQVKGEFEKQMEFLLGLVSLNPIVCCYVCYYI